MLKHLLCLLTALLLDSQGLAPHGLAVANDALRRIPENTLGFVVVRNVAAASNKFEQLLEPFDATFPAPLTFVKILTGLDEGLDPSGNLVIALMPGDGPKAPTEPMVLLPVTNYAEFAASINADTSGEVCRVTLLGEDILVAQDGPYAMLMNVEHRGTMEELVALKAESVAALTPLADWLPNNDVAVVVMPEGIEYLSKLERQPTRRFGIRYELGQSRSMLSQLLSEVSAPQMQYWLRSHVELAAIGITVDEQSNVRLSEQLVLKTRSPLAQLKLAAAQQQAAQLGLSNQPCVFTAGGPVAAGGGKRLAAYLHEEKRVSAATYGLKGLSSELWEKHKQSFQVLFQEIDSCSVVMLPGGKGEPLLGNFLGVATVPNVTKYFEAFPQVIKTWNEITEQSTSDIKPDYSFQPSTFADTPGYEIVVDIASTARDPNVPAFNWMLESALGPTGKLHIQLAQVNQTTFVFGLATPEQMTELLRAVKQEETDAPDSPEMQATLQLLEPTTPWKTLIRPQGCLLWASRVANELIAPLSDREVAIPKMPDSPPIGISVNSSGRRWTCELVCPAPTWKTLGKYLANLKDPFADF